MNNIEIEEVKKILEDALEKAKEYYKNKDYFKNEVNVFETCHSKNIFCYHKSKEITF